MPITILDLKRLEYNKTLAIQQKIQKKRINDEIDDTLILVEHDPVLTMGRRGKQDNILVPKSLFDKENIQIVDINRGGDVTYHGPGQLVGYPIVHLVKNDFGIKEFVSKVLQSIIDFLYDEYSIEAIGKSGEHTGVWVDDKKICALGISVKSGVTLHGFAFNINTNLNHFDFINPCGLVFGMVTSLQQITGQELNFDEVKQKVIEYYCNSFDIEPVKFDVKQILEDVR